MKEPSGISKRNLVGRSGLRARLIVTLCVISIFSLVILQLYSSMRTAAIVEENVATSTGLRLEQTERTLNILLSTYVEILFQVSTIERIVDMTNAICAKEDVSNNSVELRRELQIFSGLKDYIQSLAVIFPDGSHVFYDKITSLPTQNSWENTIDYSMKELFESVSKNNRIAWFRTHESDHSTRQPAYLFHIARRVIDYENINKRTGVLIMTIDENLLYEACNGNRGPIVETNHSLNFLVDKDGYIVSYTDQSFIGRKIIDPEMSQQEKDRHVHEFLLESGLLTGNNISIQTVPDAQTGWYLISASDQSGTLRQLATQRESNIILMIAFSFFFAGMVTLTTSHYISYIDRVVKAMRKAEAGNLDVQVKTDRNAPKEVVIITEQFNRMIEKIRKLIDQVKTATSYQKDAEIAALEAQINPHFLYNTLDTINWMAIEKEEFEISETIGSLANILRYGVNRSNEKVTVAHEMEWLGQYICLQRTRLKDPFEYVIEVDPHIEQCMIHKLCLQPFIENSILHGFAGLHGKLCLRVTLTGKENEIEIVIRDNGKGVSKEKLEEIRKNLMSGSKNKEHIGLQNAFKRLTMYYGKRFTLHMESKEGRGTTTTLRIPRETGGAI